MFKGLLQKGKIIWEGYYYIGEGNGKDYYTEIMEVEKDIIER